PFFYFLHIYEPHAPYNAPEPFRSASRTAYDGEIAYADSIVGGFLDHLRSRGVFDRAIIVVMGDHGEGLGDHGESTHGILLYREALHVPLLIKLPKARDGGTTVDTPAGLVDIMPTILSLTGIRPPSSLAGVSLFDAKADATRAIFSESLYGAIHLGWSALRSVADARYHFIAAPRPELYDMSADAPERNNVVGGERRTASRLRDVLAKIPDRPAAPPAVSSEEAAKLAALGYLTSRSTPSGSIDPKDGIAHLVDFEHATAAFNSGDATTAERELRAALDANPNFTDARIQLAHVDEATGRFVEAASAYREVMARDPSLAEQVLIGLATCYLNLHRLDEARSHAEAARAFNRGGAGLLLGRIALAASDARAAERHARDAMTDRHYTTAAMLLLAEALVEQRNATAAQKALSTLDTLKQTNAQRGKAPVQGLELLRSDALIRLDRVDDGVAALRAEIQQFPQNRDAYGRLAAVELLRGNSGAADQTLEQLVRANPTPASYELAAKTLEHFGRAAEGAAFRARQRAGGQPR
ncbi:MAG TPA: sulfatase-like hydrolase/transferase, partial [Thermoanaerobaculia bacterium]